MIDALIRRARRRLVVNRALAEFSMACAVGLGALALFLTLGTRYLEPWFLVPVVAAASIAAIVRVARKAPDAYNTAVLVDRNAGLHDALSTAVVFASAESDTHRLQRHQAESMVPQIDLNSAIPFTTPRTVYAVAALALLASGILAIRYFSLHGLDLRAPLTEVLFPDLAAGSLTAKKPADAETAQHKRLETAESLMAKLGMPEGPKPNDAALDDAIDRALESPGSAAAKGDMNAGDKGDKNGAAPEQAAPGDSLNGKDQDPDNPNSQANSPDGKPSSKPGSGDSPSLLSKLKDAVSNMMSKANPSDGAGKKGQAAQQPQGGKSGGEKSANKAQEQQEGQSEGESQDGDPKQGPDAQGKAGAASTQQSAQAGSGVGSQDGAKDLRAAQQLKAMGKISEIIGKRAATVSGETTVEVQSGNQQLRTEYTKKTAAHGETDSDVNRDRIPPELQSYVRQYFEQVRKTPAAKP